MEYDGGLPPKLAELHALIDVLREEAMKGRRNSKS
jgi:hypothetical protein